MVIYQKPNKELMFAGSGFLVSLITHGILHFCALIVFTLFGLIWAYEEITSGVNWFRRMLGVLALLFILFYLYHQFRS